MKNSWIRHIDFASSGSQKTTYRFRKGKKNHPEQKLQLYICITQLNYKYNMKYCLQILLINNL